MPKEIHLIERNRNKTSCEEWLSGRKERKKEKRKRQRCKNRKQNGRQKRGSGTG
jgi:hypothetical protein